MTNFEIMFNSGKTITKRGCSGYTFKDNETFKNQNGSTYTARAVLIFYGKGKKPTHYQASKVKSIKKVD